MPYTIKNYSKDYLEKQYEIGNSVLSNWPGAGQSSVENLKQAYSNENFDPDMKFYAFKGDEMVGFCTSAVIPNQPEDEEKKAFLEFPIVKPEYADASEQLYETALETLRKKGFKAVRTRAGKDWTGTEDLIKKYNYTYHSNLYKQAEFNPHEIDISHLPEPGEIQQLDFDTHTDQLIELVKNEYEIDDEQAKAAVDNLITLKDQTLFHDIIIENDKIVGRLLVYKQTPETIDNVDFTRAIVVGEKSQEYRKRLIRSAIKKLHAYPEITKARIYLAGNVQDNEELYNFLDIKFDAPLQFYEKTL